VHPPLRRGRFSGLAGTGFRGWSSRASGRRAAAVRGADLGYKAEPAMLRRLAVWAGRGYATLVMDSRGQSCSQPDRRYPRPGRRTHTRASPEDDQGLLDPETNNRRCHRRGARRRAARGHAAVDATRTRGRGRQQGGATARMTGWSPVCGGADRCAFRRTSGARLRITRRRDRTGASPATSGGGERTRMRPPWTPATTSTA